jgi:hypothetical protein
MKGIGVSAPPLPFLSLTFQPFAGYHAFSIKRLLTKALAIYFCDDYWLKS